MAKPITVTFAVLLVISCLYSAWGFPASSASSANSAVQQSQGAGVALPKKVHLVNPGGNRLYRVFRVGTNSGSDDEDLFLDEDSIVQKRGYDDYGHMRFGKRQNRGGDFDDYGHLRFGK